MRGEEMKLSKYNLLVPISNGEKFILFNTFNGSCLRIEAETAYALQQKNIELFNKEDLSLFRKTGIVIPDNIDENRIFSYMLNEEKYNSKIFSATILLTMSCNLRCTYCFQGHDNRSMTLNIEKANRIATFLTSSAKMKGSKHISIILFGGEPLVNIDMGYYILAKVKEFCEHNDMTYSSAIITNGTLLNIDIIDKLAEFNCQMIQITLDGLKKIHDSRRIYQNGKGSFDETINALMLLKEYRKIHTVIRINIDKINIDETHRLLEYIGKYNLNLTDFRVDFGIVRGETAGCSSYTGNCFNDNEVGDVLYDLWNFANKQGFEHNIRPVRKTMYCGLYSNNQFTIAPNCDVYKCWEHVGEEKHLMGKIDNYGNLTNLTYAFYDWMSMDPLKNRECSNCVYLPVCGGGCGVLSYNKTGSYHSSGCFKVKGTVEKQILKYVEHIEKENNNYSIS